MITIRHTSGAELTGAFLKWSQGSVLGKPRHFWIEPNNATSQYSCDEWEAVPEWVDVTAECAVSVDGEVIMMDGRVFSRCPSGCRLRKVPYDTIRIPRTGERREDCIIPGWAFVVERKK